MRITIPTYFTIFRLILIPLMVVFYFLFDKTYSHFLSALMFLIASITDFIDGFLARILKQTSLFGKFLDPVADKLIVSTALILLVYEYSSTSFTPLWFSICITISSLVISSREIVVTSLREWMANLGQSSKVAVSFLGKIKTFAQMTAIVWLLWRPNRYSTTWMLDHTYIEYISGSLMILAVILTIWSMFGYLKIGYISLKSLEKEENNSNIKITLKSVTEAILQQEQNNIQDKENNKK